MTRRTVPPPIAALAASAGAQPFTLKATTAVSR